MEVGIPPVQSNIVDDPPDTGRIGLALESVSSNNCRVAMAEVLTASPNKSSAL